jgi:hypothetical protein
MYNLRSRNSASQTQNDYGNFEMKATSLEGLIQPKNKF